MDSRVTCQVGSITRMKPLLVFLLPVFFVHMAFCSPVHGTTGDLDRDGDVDFEDFFILADNFGRIGAAEDDCGNLLAPAQRSDLHGEVPGLAKVFFTLYELETGTGTDWDADFEDDGIDLSWYYRDENGQRIFDLADTVTVLVDIRFYLGASTQTFEKKSEVPFFETKSVWPISTTYIRLLFEQYVPSIPSGEISTIFGTVTTVVELYITVADGRRWSARTVGLLPTRSR